MKLSIWVLFSDKELWHVQEVSSRVQSAFVSNNNTELTLSYYMVSGFVDISLLDLTFSHVLTKPGEKDSVS